MIRDEYDKIILINNFFNRKIQKKFILFKINFLNRGIRPKMCASCPLLNKAELGLDQPEAHWPGLISAQAMS